MPGKINLMMIKCDIIIFCFIKSYLLMRDLELHKCNLNAIIDNKIFTHSASGIVLDKTIFTSTMFASSFPLRVR